MLSNFNVNIIRRSGSILGFDNMAHEDGVASIGDDEEEEWMIHVKTWWKTLQDAFTASCRGGFSSFFVNLKDQKRRCL